MNSLLSGRFESFVISGASECHSSTKHAVLLLECAPHSVPHAQLVDLFLFCFQQGVRLLLPSQHCSLLPLVSAAYDISIAPLRTLVRSLDVDITLPPLPFSLAATADSSGPLRVLDAAAVLLVTQQIDPLCLLLKPSAEASLESGATWLGLYSNSSGNSSSNRSSNSNNSSSNSGDGGSNSNNRHSHRQQTGLQVAVGVSARGQVWVHRAAGYQDWKQVAAVLHATLAMAGAHSSARLVCVIPAADQVLMQALTCPHSGFTPPPSTPPPPTSAATSTATTITVVSDVEDEEAGCFDCIIFNEDIAQQILDPPTPPPPAATPNLLFFLAGQSNMSGRGRLSDLVVDSSLEDVRRVHDGRGEGGAGGGGLRDNNNTSPFVVKCLSSSSSPQHSSTSTSASTCSVHLSPPYARRVKAFDAKDFKWTEL